MKNKSTYIEPQWHFTVTSMWVKRYTTFKSYLVTWFWIIVSIRLDILMNLRKHLSYDKDKRKAERRLQVWYLIVSFPDLCRLSYFQTDVLPRWSNQTGKAATANELISIKTAFPIAENSIFDHKYNVIDFCDRRFWRSKTQFSFSNSVHGRRPHVQSTR